MSSIQELRPDPGTEPGGGPQSSKSAKARRYLETARQMEDHKQIIYPQRRATDGDTNNIGIPDTPSFDSLADTFSDRDDRDRLQVENDRPSQLRPGKVGDIDAAEPA